MNKKIFTSLIIGGLVTSTLYAYGGDCPSKDRSSMVYKKNMQYKNMMYHKSKHGDNMPYHSSFKNTKHRDHFAGIFRKLDLNKKQRFEISIIKDEMKLELKKLRGYRGKNRILSYINDSGFDSETYKKEMISMSTKRVEIMADYMAKMLKVLTKEQIDQLKKSMIN